MRRDRSPRAGARAKPSAAEEGRRDGEQHQARRWKKGAPAEASDASSRGSGSGSGVRRRAGRSKQEHINFGGFNDDSLSSSAVYAGGPSSAEMETSELSSSDSTETVGRRFSWDIPRRDDDRRRSWSKARSAELPASHVPSAAARMTAPSTTVSGLRQAPRAEHNDHSAAHQVVASSVRLKTPANATALVTAAESTAGKTQALRVHRSANFWTELSVIAGTTGTVAYMLHETGNKALGGSALQLSLILAISLASIPSFHASEACIWTTERRHYRAVVDQGHITAMLFGPMLAGASLVETYNSDRKLSAIEDTLPWLVSCQANDATGLGLMATARKALLSTQSVIFAVTAIHLWATRLYGAGFISFHATAWNRFRSFAAFSTAVSACLVAAHYGLRHTRVGLWKSLDTWEIMVASMVYQCSLYTISRLARKSFTVGELTVVAIFGVTLLVEAINLTLAKVLPLRQALHTFRPPDVLLVYQLALIVGTFAIGFLLSPILYLSRYLAQRPTHRLRWPHNRNMHRKLLSASFFLFAAAFVVGVLGYWVSLFLGGANPWSWALQFCLQGRRVWARPALISYWVILVTASVSAWQRIIAAPRRHVHAVPAPTPSGMIVKEVKDGEQVASDRIQGKKQRPSSTMKKAAHLSVNARRKFFHGLAVMMFIPGILLEADFTHLALSLALSVFTFAEYIRYFALIPLGAPLHVFLSEFLDSKDSGPVILSHFYLLTGCALPLWLDARTSLARCSGVIVLGIGDALASVVGRKYGLLHWPRSSKTLEGSAAFAASIFISGLALQALDPVAHVRPLRWLLTVILITVLEGTSDQNDNLVLPVLAHALCSIFAL